MVKQRADEVLKNPAKDTVSSPFSNWRKHGTKTAFIHRRECQNAADDLNRRTSRGAVTRFEAVFGLPLPSMSKIPLNWQILAIYSLDFIGRIVWTERGKLTVENSNEITRLFWETNDSNYLHEMYEEAN